MHNSASLDPAGLLNLRILSLRRPISLILSVWARVQQKDLLISPYDKLSKVFRLLEEPLVEVKPHFLVLVCELSCKMDLQNWGLGGI